MYIDITVDTVISSYIHKGPGCDRGCPFIQSAKTVEMSKSYSRENSSATPPSVCIDSIKETRTWSVIPGSRSVSVP